MASSVAEAFPSGTLAETKLSKSDPSVLIAEVIPSADDIAQTLSNENIQVDVAGSQARKVRPRRTLESFSLEGKVCVVTGGASGIGLEICRAIIASGGQVAIVDLNSKSKDLLDRKRNELLISQSPVSAAEQQAKALQSDYHSTTPDEELPFITAHAVDVSSPPSIERAIASVLSQHGIIDHLVSSAGICENFPATTYPYARMQKLMAINVDGTYCFATAVARHLLGRGAAGNMVFIGSMSGSIVNMPQPQTPYNMSKAAVIHMAKSLAVEWATCGIRVNCISPGYMRTALTEEIMRKDPPLYKEWVDRTPVRQLGNPKDIAGAAVFLLSDASSYMTGADVVIDGGYTCI